MCRRGRGVWFIRSCVSGGFWSGCLYIAWRGFFGVFDYFAAFESLRLLFCAFYGYILFL